MKIKWLIQTSGFNTPHIMSFYNAIERQNIDLIDFGLITKTNIITNIENIIENDVHYIIKGGTKLLTILNSINHLKDVCLNPELIAHLSFEESEKQINLLKSGIDYNIDNFDQFKYKDLNLPLLNSNAKYYQYEEIKNTKFYSDMFIKPSRDLKSFNGGIIPQNTSIKDFILNGMHQLSYKDETIIISPLQKIYTEYRFFVIEDEIITGSLYKRGDVIFPERLIPEYVMSVAKEYAKLYKPADIFVMDLAETDDGIKIIEYNCWNASGPYAVDINKLVYEITEYKKSKYGK